MLTFNFRTNVLKAIQVTWFFIFCDICRSVIIHFDHLHGLSMLVSRFCPILWGTLNLADVADVFVANSIPRNVADDALKS